MFGAKLSWCQIVRCQIVLVPNCPGAKLSTFIILVPNCPLLSSWCQIVRFIILVPNCPVPNCPTIRGRVGHAMKVCSAPDCVLVYKSLCVQTCSHVRKGGVQEHKFARGQVHQGVVLCKCRSVGTVFKSAIGRVCVYCLPRCY